MKTQRQSETVTNITLILSSLSALLTFVIVSTEHHADFPSKQEIATWLLFFPNLAIAIGCFFSAISNLSNKKQRGKSTFVLLLSLVTPVRGGYEMYYPNVQRDDDRRMAHERRLDEWRNMGATINPLLREYYLTNKSNCKFPHNDNEAELDGFADYAADHGIVLKNGRIVDPWGDPVHFVIAHEGDRALRAQGQFYGIADQSPGKITVGLLLDNPSRVDTASCRQWALQNGYVPIYPRTVY